MILKNQLSTKSTKRGKQAFHRKVKARKIHEKIQYHRKCRIVSQQVNGCA